MRPTGSVYLFFEVFLSVGDALTLSVSRFCSGRIAAKLESSQRSALRRTKVLTWRKKEAPARGEAPGLGGRLRGKSLVHQPASVGAMVLFLNRTGRPTIIQALNAKLPLRLRQKGSLITHFGQQKTPANLRDLAGVLE